MILGCSIHPQLTWSEFFHLLEYLTLNELYRLGCTCRSAFMSFLHQKNFRLSSRYQSDKNFLSPRFLPKGSGHMKVLLVSYPRSGNSFLRQLLEFETGIVTGSDSRPNRTLSASLLTYGYCGEGVVDESVWIVKSHFPERLGYCKFNASKVILLIRNPFDSIESYFHMGLTNTHNKKLSDKVFKSLEFIWSEFIIHEAKVWCEFHNYWMESLKLIPHLIIRHEDILQNEKEVVGLVRQFITADGVPRGYRRFIPIEKRKQAINPSSEVILTELNKTDASKSLENDLNTSSNPIISSERKSEVGLGYKPNTVSIGKALKKYSSDQIRILMALPSMSHFMDLYGYQLKDIKNQDNQNCFSLEIQEMKQIHGSSNMAIPLAESHPRLTINRHASIRGVDDKFGRKITDLRRSMTNLDTKPFETII